LRHVYFAPKQFGNLPYQCDPGRATLPVWFADAPSRCLTEGILQSSGDTPKCSVLIVEDDRVTREALTKLLQMFGYATCPVATVAEGVAKLDGQACAIVDLNLPDGVGTYILQRIKSEKRPMRVAVCTGTTDESLVTKARAFGAEVIFRKPLDVNALFDWLNNVG